MIGIAHMCWKCAISMQISVNRQFFVKNLHYQSSYKFVQRMRLKTLHWKLDPFIISVSSAVYGFLISRDNDILTVNRRLLCCDIVDDCDVTVYDAKAREMLETVPLFLLELGNYLDKTSIFFVMDKNNYMYTGTLHVPRTYESGELWLHQPPWWTGEAEENCDVPENSFPVPWGSSNDVRSADHYTARTVRH